GHLLQRVTLPRCYSLPCEAGRVGEGAITTLSGTLGNRAKSARKHRMDLQLNTRRALITGSTAGIGYAIAHGLAAEGAQVTITGRTQASVDAALARLANAFPNVRADGIAADCATAAGAEAVFARVPDVDILVNNLGIYE